MIMVDYAGVPRASGSAVHRRPKGAAPAEWTTTIWVSTTYVQAAGPPCKPCFSSNLITYDEAGSSLVVQLPGDCEVRDRCRVGRRGACRLSVAGGLCCNRSCIAVSLRYYVQCLAWWTLAGLARGHSVCSGLRILLVTPIYSLAVDIEEIPR